MICAVTCFYNPCGYRNLVRNYDAFRERLSDVELFTIELTFGRRYLPEATITIEGSPQHLMWQKERLLNRLVETLPSKYDKIAWLDADLVFANRKWASEASRRLDQVPVVQLFESVRYTSDKLGVESIRPGMVKCVQEGKPVCPLPGAPGFAWAARREVFPLYDANVVGCGDLLMAFAWYGHRQGIADCRLGAPWQQHVSRWSEQAYRQVQGRLDCISGVVTHLYHGSRENRNYEGRMRYLADYRFDPSVDLALDDNGLWKWASDKPTMHRLVAGYFTQRKEDDSKK